MGTFNSFLFISEFIAAAAFVILIGLNLPAQTSDKSKKEIANDQEVEKIKKAA